jgi:hypothetical protein
MKKLLLFSGLLLGSVSLTMAQTGKKKVKAAKPVEQVAQTQTLSAAKPKPAQKATPASALSLFDASKPAPATEKKANK